MILHLYFARRFLVTFIGVYAAFFVMLGLVDMLEQVRRFDSDAVSFGAIVTLTLLNVPEGLYRILPLAVILAGVALFIAMGRSSEMVIAKAAGRAALTAVLAPVLVAALIGCVGVAVLNPLVAATSKQYDVLAGRYLDRTASVSSISRGGLWLRQGDKDGQTVIRAARAGLDGTELSGVSFLSFDEDGLPAQRIEAARARLTPGAWEVEDAKLWPLKDSDNPERDAREYDTLSIATNLTQNEIVDSFGIPSAIPIWELPGFIARLERAGFSARQHRVWFQMEMALPLLLAAMVLISASFTLRPARFGRTGLMVVYALLLGFSLYFIRNFAQILGENGQIPIFLAAWGPPVAAALLPLGLLLHQEDG